mmetsp:Transcript_35250/g.77560  ORF Transcript_35250/g.77560 Transcript_35250/m.77560 type:complete len:238 (+) Transcript_35250:953-1666(+)
MASRPTATASCSWPTRATTACNCCSRCRARARRTRCRASSAARARRPDDSASRAVSRLCTASSSSPNSRGGACRCSTPQAGRFKWCRSRAADACVGCGPTRSACMRRRPHPRCTLSSHPRPAAAVPASQAPLPPSPAPPTRPPPPAPRTPSSPPPSAPRRRRRRRSRHLSRHFPRHSRLAVTPSTWRAPRLAACTCSASRALRCSPTAPPPSSCDGARRRSSAGSTRTRLARTRGST